jgi:small subunit ribosomal protein S4
VAHGNIRVNGAKVDRPSFQLKVGDVVTVKEKLHKTCREQMESLQGHQVPGWVEVNPAELRAKVLTMPSSDQIPFDVNTNLIVEFYR